MGFGEGRPDWEILRIAGLGFPDWLRIGFNYPGINNPAAEAELLETLPMTLKEDLKRCVCSHVIFSDVDLALLHMGEADLRRWGFTDIYSQGSNRHPVI